MELQLASTITCPECVHQAKEKNADYGVSIFPRLQKLKHTTKTQGRRLLCLLFLRNGKMPACTRGV